jgi:ABC-type histidine transport system ATPase subunit
MLTQQGDDVSEVRARSRSHRLAFKALIGITVRCIAIAVQRFTDARRTADPHRSRFGIQRIGAAFGPSNPKLLLLDEITSALGPELVGELLNVVRELAADSMTMLLVTHEMSFARDVSARVVSMDAGRVAVQGTPRELFSGQNHDRLRSFRCRIEMRY